MAAAEGPRQVCAADHLRLSDRVALPRRGWKWVGLALAVAALVAVLGWLWGGGQRAGSETAGSAPTPNPSPSGRDRAARDVPPPGVTARPSRARRTSAPGPGAPDEASHCEPYVARDCYGGNVHWFDACGHVLDMDADCGDGFCRRGACVAADWEQRCVEPPHGRCDGDRVVYCDAGETAFIDCAAKGRVCRDGAEGAACVTLPPEGACSFDAPRCDGDILEFCAAGKIQQLHCNDLGGACVEIDGQARCTRPPPPVPAEQAAACGPCGCPSEAEGEPEVCNGKDDDGNGYIDDGVDCGLVTIDVWVGTGEHRERLIDEAGLRFEIDAVNHVFERSGSAIRFTLGSIQDLDVAGSAALTFDQLAPLLDQLEPPTVSRSVEDPEQFGEAPYSARLVFVGELLEGEVPKLGVAYPFVTRGCGAIRHEGGPRYKRSLIAISERRSRTTLAHELGHLLGLCHTHDGEPKTSVVAPHADPEQLCGDWCSYEGDAICDTPPDHRECDYDSRACIAICPGGEQPDTRNIMSYYHACRTRFSPQQVLLMEHTLALRRAWRQCRDGACPCEPAERDCPSGMSCRPGGAGAASGFACGMDGPQLPGGRCDSNAQCSAHSLCVAAEHGGRCARTCGRTSEGCICVATDTSTVSVCREDLLVAP